MPRYFTKEEAEAVLPEIRPLVEQAQQRALVLQRLRDEVTVVEKRIKGDGHARNAELLAEKQEAAREVTREVERLVQQAQNLGGEIKDLGMGLVDFRALREGRDVYLCWRLGEQGISWWHTLESGFGGRQPL